MWSFGFAGQGIVCLLRTQPNFRIHVGLAALAVVLGAVLHLGSMEWAMLVLAIGLVLAVEGLNTGLEALCDRVSPACDPLIKQAKDVSAGAVLISASAALVVGGLLFGPRLLALIR